MEEENKPYSWEMNDATDPHLFKGSAFTWAVWQLLDSSNVALTERGPDTRLTQKSLCNVLGGGRISYYIWETFVQMSCFQDDMLLSQTPF